MTQWLGIIARRSAALAILAAIAIGGLATLASAWETLTGLNERIDTQRSLLGRYVASKVAGDDISADDGPQAAASYLPGETDAVRLAALQSILDDAAKARNIRLASTSAADTTEQGGVRLLGLRTQFSTDLEPLQRLLFDLEQQRQGLIVDGLHVSKAPDGGAQHMPALDVSFVLLGAVPAKKE